MATNLSAASTPLVARLLLSALENQNAAADRNAKADVAILLGGFIGAILFALPAVRSRHINFWKLMDAAAPGMGRLAAMDATLMMLPRPRASIGASTAWQQTITARRLIRSISSQARGRFSAPSSAAPRRAIRRSTPR